MNTNKRTRSQLQIAEFDVSFGRSPLKDAKRAMRKVNLNGTSRLSNMDVVDARAEGASESLETSVCVDTSPDIEDDILLSPRKSEDPSQAKRSSPPSFDISMESGEVNPPKRPKLKVTSADSGVKGPLDMFFVRQASSQSTPKQNTAARRIFSETMPPSSAKPKPLIPETPTLKKLRELPEIDLRTMTPSPRKAAHGLGLVPKLNLPPKGVSRAVSEGSVAHVDGNTTNAGKSSDIPELGNTYLVPTPALQSEAKFPLDKSTVIETEQVFVENNHGLEDGQEEEQEEELANLDPPVTSDQLSMTGFSRESSLSPLTSSPPSSPKQLDVVLEKQAEAGPSGTLQQTEEPATRLPQQSSLVVTTMDKIQDAPTTETVPLSVTEVVGASTSSSASRLKPKNSTVANDLIRRKKRHPKPITSSTPRIRMTRAAALRQQKLAQQRASAVKFISPTKPKAISSVHIARKSLAKVTTCPADDPPTRPSVHLSKEHTKLEITSKPASKVADEEPHRSHRPFVITKPSSLSPEKRSSMSGFDLFSTSSFFPPPVKDPASRARTAATLSNLNSALEKLALPPPSKPCSSSDESEKERPSTSMGFTRELDEQLVIANRPGTASRPASRAGSVVPGRKTLFPPPPPLFSGSAINDKGKGKVALPLKHFSFGKSMTSGQAGPSSIFGSGSSRNMFAKPLARMKASQKTTLETVQGSPVKPSSSDMEIEDFPMPSSNLFGIENKSDSKHGGDGNTSIASGDSNDVVSGINDTESGNVSADGKELKKITKLNASRRASMAFSALSQTLATPQANDESTGRTVQPPASTGASSSDKKPSVNALFSAPSSRPVRAAAPRSFTATATPSGISRTQSESVLHGSSTSSAATGESDGEESTRTGKKGMSNRSKMPRSLDILNKCTIFVDVKTEDGEDAGALFVDMLRGLGAKILARVGQTCTHIVYKNGLPSTLTRYRLLGEPRPLVVNISWVVECVEKRERIDESRFAVDLEAINVAGANRRRKSFIPKQLPVTGPMDTFMASKAASSSAEKKSSTQSPFNFGPNTLNDEDSEDSKARLPLSNSKLTPLDMARRRNVTNPR